MIKCGSITHRTLYFPCSSKRFITLALRLILCMGVDWGVVAVACGGGGGGVGLVAVPCYCNLAVALSLHETPCDWPVETLHQSCQGFQHHGQRRGPWRDLADGVRRLDWTRSRGGCAQRRSDIVSHAALFRSVMYREKGAVQMRLSHTVCANLFNPLSQRGQWKGFLTSGEGRAAPRWKWAGRESYEWLDWWI